MVGVDDGIAVPVEVTLVPVAATLVPVGATDVLVATGIVLVGCGTPGVLVGGTDVLVGEVWGVVVPPEQPPWIDTLVRLVGFSTLPAPSVALALRT
jgi:hypothetical protein